MVMARRANPSNSPSSSDPGILALKNMIAYSSCWFSVCVYFIRSGPQPCRISLRVATLLFICSVVSDSLWPHGLQHARPPCPSPSWARNGPAPHFIRQSTSARWVTVELVGGGHVLFVVSSQPWNVSLGWMLWRSVVPVACSVLCRVS